MIYGNLLPHRRLRDLATKYGPLMHIQLGEVSAVIVSSAELAKEFLQTKDVNFAWRPNLPSVDTIFYQGRDICFGNGEYWKHMRKICAQELLGANRVKSFLPAIEEEVNQLVTSIHHQQSRNSSSAVNIGGMLVCLGQSLISRTAFGKIKKHSEAFSPVAREVVKAIEGSNLWDLFPSSYLVRLLTSSESNLKKVHAIIAILQTVLQKKKGRVLPLPPGPWKLPIIGNLHQMIYGNLLPHHRLRDLATKYGPLMHLQLGEVSIVVVSSAELAKEFLQTKDVNFAWRPYMPSAHTIFYQGRDISFGNGEYWKHMRRICTQELLGANRVKSLVPTFEEEVDQLVTSIRSRNSSSAINIGGMLLSLGQSLISRTAFGKIKKHSDCFSSIAREIIKAVEGSNLRDLFPSSYLVRLLTSSESALKKLHDKADATLEIIIQDHIAKRSAKTSNSVDEVDEDLVDVLLNHSLDPELEIPITIDNIKAVLLDLFIGGSDTSLVTIEWALAELMRNSEVMKKVQKEIRAQYDGKGRIDYENLDQLHYFKLVIKETFRLHPPTTLLPPREAREAAVIGGYQIPAKTRIIINAWAIAHDHRNWCEPERFYPERFLNDLSSTPDYFKGLDFAMMPFGSGRRICPGIQYGMTLATICFANLLYHFDWELPPGIISQNLDMSEEFGVTVKKKNDLFLVPITYHPTAL
ncbi:Desmethyl-deoxy-podophyllotoxin synthase [Linum grandiflorum]